ncbi:MAG: hypothetical protein ACE14W_02665 [Candidatus Velamenicoccus archaeovorus]
MSDRRDFVALLAAVAFVIGVFLYVSVFGPRSAGPPMPAPTVRPTVLINDPSLPVPGPTRPLSA